VVTCHDDENKLNQRASVPKIRATKLKNEERYSSNTS
jgi:hypothetical protein